MPFAGSEGATEVQTGVPPPAGGGGHWVCQQTRLQNQTQVYSKTVRLLNPKFEPLPSRNLPENNTLIYSRQEEVNLRINKDFILLQVFYQSIYKIV